MCATANPIDLGEELEESDRCCAAREPGGLVRLDLAHRAVVAQAEADPYVVDHLVEAQVRAVDALEHPSNGRTGLDQVGEDVRPGWGAEAVQAEPVRETAPLCEQIDRSAIDDELGVQQVERHRLVGKGPHEVVHG